MVLSKKIDEFSIRELSNFIYLNGDEETPYYILKRHVIDNFEGRTLIVLEILNTITDIEFILEVEDSSTLVGPTNYFNKQPLTAFKWTITLYPKKENN